MENKIVINVEHLTKIYRLYNRDIDRVKEAISICGKRYSKDFFALNDVSFKVRKGETLGIIGRNGAGKSTLLKVLTGVLTPSSGKIVVDGKVAALLELGAGFNPEMTGIENIYMNGTIMGFSKSDMDKKIDDILDFADIGDFISQPVKMYSSGMFARLAFAVAINVEPEVLIVDEALAVGDAAFQRKCYRKFDDFRRAKKTILFVTHSTDSVLQYCTSAMLMDHGRVIITGNTKQVVDTYKILTSSGTTKKNENTNMKNVLATASSWKKLMHENKNRLEYGNKKAVIIDYGLFDGNGELSTSIKSDECVTLRFKVYFNETIEEPIFAFAVKSLKGLEIAGTNTYIEKKHIGICKAGNTICVEFKQSLNLQVGTYTISLGCTKYGDKDLEIFHRLYDVFFIGVNTNKEIFGLYDVHSKISILR